MTRTATCVAVTLLPLALIGAAGCELMVAGPRAEASDVWERTYEVGTEPSFSLSNTNGAVTIRVHDQPRITVRAERTAKATTEEGARELLDGSLIQEDLSEGAVSLSTRRQQSLLTGQQVQVRYDVQLPSNARASVRTTNGALSVEGVRGAVELETVNGRLRGRDLGQVRRAETVNGSIDLEMDALPEAGCTVETVNGSVTVSVPAASRASVSVRTVNGSITVRDFPSIDERDRSRRRFEGELNGGGTPLRVETVNGSVTVQGRGPTT